MSDVEARLAAAEDTEARVEILREEVAAREDRIAELQQTRDRFETERETLKQQLAEALAPHTVLDAADLVENFTLEELRAKEPDHSDRQATLSDTEPAVLSGGSERQHTTLSPAARERAAELEARLDELPDHDRGLAARQREHIEEQLADLRGEA